MCCAGQAPRGYSEAIGGRQFVDPGKQGRIPGWIDPERDVAGKGEQLRFLYSTRRAAGRAMALRIDPEVAGVFPEAAGFIAATA